jgi:glycosyltransferase involved in cell wall biosynthesis
MEQKVSVLMAVLNGEKFISDQLESIFCQKDCIFDIHLGDNGSNDRTQKIISKYFELGLISSITTIKKKGYTHCFFQLIDKVEDGNYIAFSDQDDLWDQRKLCTLLESTNATDAPQLTFSNRDFIDESGKLIRLGRSNNLTLSWHNAVIQNVAPGNTILLNPSGVKLIKRLGEVSVKHYDSWIYLVISLFGKVEYIPKSLVSYRLHTANSVGLRKTWTPRVWATGIQEYLSQVILLGELLQKQSSLRPPEEFLDFLFRLSHKRFIMRLSVVFKVPLCRQGKLETILFKLAIVPFLVFRN